MNITKYLAAAGALALAVLLIASAPREDQAGGMYKPAVKTATITNTGADTTLVPVNLVSLWNYNWVASATQTSGTTAIIVAVQESNEATGNLWYEVSRDTVSVAAGGLIKAQSGQVNGLRQRIIATGVGTHVSAYRLTGTFKRIN